MNADYIRNIYKYKYIFFSPFLNHQNYNLDLIFIYIHFFFFSFTFETHTAYTTARTADIFTGELTRKTIFEAIKVGSVLFADTWCLDVR